MEEQMGVRALLRDGRLIRLVLVALVGLVLSGFVVQQSDVIRLSNLWRHRPPQLAIIPTPELVNPALDDSIIFPGERVTRNIVAGGYQNWTFDGVAGQIVDFSVMPFGAYDASFDLSLELFDTDGNQLLVVNENGSGQPEFLRGYEIPSSGTYSLWVSDAAFNHSGAYVLAYLPYRYKATHPMRLGVGTALRNRIEVGQFDMWVFSGEAGQSVSLTLVPFDEYESQFVAAVEIFDPSGNRITSIQAAGASESLIARSIELPETGDYTIWIYEQDFDHAGDYAFTVQQRGEKVNYFEFIPDN